MVEESKGNLLERFVPILLVASVGLAFVVGVLWQKVNNLEGGETAGVADAKPTVAVQPQRPTTGKLPADQAKKIVAVSDDDHIQGSRDAKVFLIEYSDYECPFCSRFHATAQQVVDEYDGQVAWVYRHFPLDQMHKNARKAAEAAECVAEIKGEDAWWAYTNALYKDQAKVGDFMEVASGIGVSSTALQSCLDDGKYSEKVDKQHKGGLASGVTGTPGNLVVNSKGETWLVPGALPFEQLKTTIDEALGK